VSTSAAHASLFAPDGRAVIVAVDHGLYSWPVAGLEDRAALIRSVVEAGADGIIASYGTIRDCRASFGEAAAILKLDLTTLTLHGYADTESRAAWRVEDAKRLGAAAVLTLVQLGTPHELGTLHAAARVAAEADAAGVPYVCEALPYGSERFPAPLAPEAIAAAARVAAELGAHVVKTSMPTPPEAIADAAPAGIPILIAGGDLQDDRDALFDATGRAIQAGAAGVAYGRNVWASADPAATVRRLHAIVHG
jgi:class I fructose-bisphosphate aldolase/fructose-bisphosphate aldolase/2-amino-3,7-dideoxy-D-threo-hept-6-ulosonate synthase